jgi:hypothetical protein
LLVGGIKRYIYIYSHVAHLSEFYMVHSSDVLFFLVKENFKIYHVCINGRKGVAWLVGYITPKNSWLVKWIKITSGERASPSRAKHWCSERDDEKYCKLLVITPTPPKTKALASQVSKTHLSFLPTSSVVASLGEDL